MDQLAPVINWFKRNGFWLVSFLVAALLIGGWFLASSQIEEETNSQVRKLKQSFSDMSGVRRVSAVTEEDGVEESVVAHPNATTEEKMTEELKETIDAIAEVWQQKRDQQEPLLVFPKDILGANTFQFFDQGKAAEDFPVDLVSSATEKTYLRTYREQIPKQVAKIARHLRAYWKYDEELIEAQLKAEAEASALGGYGGAMGMAMGGMGMGYGMGEDVVDLKQNKYAVLWNETNQNLWQRKMIEFRNWDDNSGSTQDPTVLQAYTLQQDIWLLEAMFNVIRKVNGEATTTDLAVIKEIDYVAFGREARSKLGLLADADKRLGGAKVPVMGDDGMGGYGGGMSGMEGMGMGMDMGMDGMEGGTDGFDINADPSPFHGRYVDANQEAIPAEMVRTVINGEELPEENLELIVAKRVPFRLAVKMDERKINDFLALCANSPFSFEVQQIPINKHDPKTVLEFKGGVEQRKSVAMDAMGGMGGMMEGMGYGMDGMMGGMGGGFTQQKLDNLESTPVETRLSYDVRVEFYGIVRIYNRVRKDFLLKAVGLEPENPTEEDDATLDGGVAVLDRR
jgi:hypothetical protein